MDDKLINLIVTVVIIGIWVVQFIFKAKPQQDERQFDDDDDEDETSSDRPRNTYAEDPYIQVQEEIRRKIAERKAAEQAASQTKQTAPQSRPLVAQEQRPAASSRPHPTPPQPARSAQTIDDIRRRREQVEQGFGRQSNVSIDRELRPIPTAQLPNRSFPTAQSNSAQHGAFPAAARSGLSAYQGSTKLRRQANPRNVALKQALRSAGSTRQAVLLREILGEPVGLREGERRF